MRRVVVTGMGAITPIGNDVETFWNGLKEKKLGFGPITYFDTTDYKAKLAAEVKDFEPKDYMDPKAARRMERFAQFAVAAARQALEDSSLDMTKEDPFRVGVCVSSGIGSLQIIEKEYKKLLEKGPNRVNPLLVPLMISNMAAGNVSIQFGLKGKNINVVTACASGTNSIGEAMRAIQHLSLIHISEPTRRTPISYAVFCLKKKNRKIVCRLLLTKKKKNARGHSPNS